MSGSTRTQAAPRRRGAAAATGRARPTPRLSLRRRLPRPGLRALGILLVIIILGGGAFLWFRTSSLVAIRQVTITGVSGPDASKIRAALKNAAREMTTLDVRRAALHTAVAPFPVVKHLRVSTSFPHTMRIEVIEQVPVAEVSDGGRLVPVSADGTLLHDASVSGPLPTIALSVPPGGTHVDGPGKSEVRLLGAAPYALLAKVGQVSTDPHHGFVATLRNGPKIYFGMATHLAAKWTAAAAVLASSSSDGAVYIDVTDPARPAAGTGSDAASSASTSPSASSAATPPAGGSTGGAAATSPATAGSTGGG